MSWSITINNLPDYAGFTTDVIEQMLTQHMAYPADMALALEVARKAGLASASLSGGRTPNPYGDDEVVIITVTGMGAAQDFESAMRRNIAAGPDEAALAEQQRASLIP
jgi:hypothetical protein